MSEVICINCRKPKRLLIYLNEYGHEEIAPCVGEHRTWPEHNFYEGTEELGEHSHKAELADEELYKAKMRIRGAYREGQRDMLKKIESIIKSYVYGEGEQCVEELKGYCENYIYETNNDLEICDQIVNTNKLR